MNPTDVDATHRPAPGVPARRASFMRTCVAVAWSFIGVRKDSEYREDLNRLNPLHVIVIGMAGALMFVLSLAAIAHWVVAK